MKFLYKVYYLEGEGWYCFDRYMSEKEAKQKERALRGLGYRTMLRKMSM